MSPIGPTGPEQYIYAYGGGTATITAKVGDLTATCEVTVIQEDTPVYVEINNQNGESTSFEIYDEFFSVSISTHIYSPSIDGNKSKLSAVYSFVTLISSSFTPSSALSLDLKSILPTAGIATNDTIARSIITANNSTKVNPFFILSPNILYHTSAINST